MTYEQWETELRTHLVNHNAIWCAAHTDNLRKLMLEYWYNYGQAPIRVAGRLNARWNKRIQKLQELNQ